MSRQALPAAWLLALLALAATSCRPAPRLSSATPTDGPPVTPDLGAVGLPGGRLLFQDDFSRPDSGWEVFDDGPAAAAYVAGEYRLLLNRAPLRAWGVLRGVPVPADAAITVTSRLEAGAASSAYGVLCRFVDEDHFYFFTLTGAGEYLIGKHRGDDLVGLSGPRPAASGAILPAPAQNLITAECRGDRLSLAVNAIPVAEARDAELADGRIGLVAVAAEGAGAEARFDNLAVYAP